MSEDTNSYEGPVETQDFKSAGFRVTWSLSREEADKSYRAKNQIRHVYIPSDEAKKWDGAFTATHALGSTYGGYTYCHIKMTGRQMTQSPSGLWGVRCKITLNLGGDISDIQIVNGWCLEES